MVSWKDEIVDPQNTTISQFGGITINRILQYFKATDLANNDTDQNGIADIATATIFKSEALKLWDSDKSHKIKFQTPNYTENHTWTFPNEAAMPTTDEFLFKDAVAIVTGKTLDFGSANVAQNIPKAALPNTIIHNDQENSLGDHYIDFGDITAPSPPASGLVRLFFDDNTDELSVIHSNGSVVSLEEAGEGGGAGNGGFVAGGLVQFNGNSATTTVFNIPHTMDPQPDAVNVLPTSVDALGEYTIDIGSTNITITYQIAPPTGTNNVEFYWSAGYINEATSGFSPTTINTITNKTINVDQNTIKHSTTNNAGDMIVFDGTRFNRFARGTSNQILAMNSVGSNVIWTSSTGGGSGGGGFSAGGSMSFSGNGSTTVFNIPHGLITQPETYFAVPASDDAAGHYKLTIDGTNIIVTFAVAPFTGSNNVTFIWGAGYITSAIAGFTPGSTTTLTNKTLGDFLKIVKQGTTPTNPSNIEDSILYIRAIDADNNGLFLKSKKGNQMVEIQIA